MKKKLMNALHRFVCLAVIVQFVGCGTILYPERKGQKSGKLDVGIVLLDGVGLLFFFIPGIIAFAVDFSNGTIYLPGTRGNLLGSKSIQEIKFDPKQCNTACVEKVIQKETGYEVKLRQSNMQVVELKSTDEILARFAQVVPEIQMTQLRQN